ncbi:MAG: hypothetical protein V4568_02075 [Pseudomonadota bacterium]
MTNQDVNNLVFIAQAELEKAQTATMAMETAVEEVRKGAENLKRHRYIDMKNIGLIFIAMAFSTVVAILVSRELLPSKEKLASLQRQIDQKRAELISLNNECR